jgi:hypothetical protein
MILCSRIDNQIYFIILFILNGSFYGFQLLLYTAGIVKLLPNSTDQFLMAARFPQASENSGLFRP